MSDDELRAHVRLAAAGDARALRLLLVEPGRRVHACALRMTGDEFAAEEITHDALLALLRNVDSIRSDAGTRAWLMRVASNLARDWLRRTGNRTRPIAVPADIPAGGDGADAAAVRDDARRRLNDAAQQLPTPYREILALRFAAGLDYDEIATVLGCPAGSVASRLHRALRRLGTALARQGLTLESFR